MVADFELYPQTLPQATANVSAGSGGTCPPAPQEARLVPGGVRASMRHPPQLYGRGGARRIQLHPKNGLQARQGARHERLRAAEGDSLNEAQIPKPVILSESATGIRHAPG